MENETELNFIGTPKVNEDIDFVVSYYNITEDNYQTNTGPYQTQFIWFNSQNIIFNKRYNSSNLSLSGKTYSTLFSNNNTDTSINSLENSDTYTLVLKQPVFGF